MTVVNRLAQFLDASPTPFHAVENMRAALLSAGFQELNEADAWDLKAAQRYFTTRNGASIVAWQMPADALAESGLRMVGAHTDSPCLKVKPKPELHQQGYWQLGVEVYGGVLLNPWFDRGLALAGRLTCLDEDGALCHHLIDFKRAIAVIPSLAIHLDREANKSRSINAQTMLPPILGQSDQALDFRALLRDELARQGVVVSEVIDYELSFYDTQGAETVGLNNELFMSARLDNLLSCFMGLEALLTADAKTGMLLVCNDHEEVGSMSATGAQGPMLENVLMRMLPDAEQRICMLARSMMISADNAHGIHPNFADRHDANHGPLLNAGPVIKLNANQRYASTDVTSAIFKLLARDAGVSVQEFVVRSDMACGSTIGPITSAELGVKTLDIGVPQFGMHSIRETAGVQDVEATVEVLTRFYQLDSLPA